MQTVVNASHQLEDRNLSDALKKAKGTSETTSRKCFG